jgi:hypothetical protein
MKAKSSLGGGIPVDRTAAMVVKGSSRRGPQVQRPASRPSRKVWDEIQDLIAEYRSLALRTPAPLLDLLVSGLKQSLKETNARIEQRKALVNEYMEQRKPLLERMRKVRSAKKKKQKRTR